jgi:GMP synthase (glutamine-hydrolysing)
VSEARLKAKLWVHAVIRQCGVLAIPAMVVRKGDEDAGAVLVKLNRGAAGCEVFTQVRDGTGEAAWLRATGPDPVEEAKADAYISRQRDRDCDLWVLEIEDRQGRVPFLDRIIS